MRYLPHTESEISDMLHAIGVANVDALFADIPKELQLNRALALPETLDEPSLMTHLQQLASRNTGAELLSFAGAGAYRHHIPPALDQLLLRSEFYTAYTPYQPELSQGTLQAIFEFQTMVCEILGTEIANASMYDGASATAEAALMAMRITGRSDIIVSEGVHPEYRETLNTYLCQVEATPLPKVLPLQSDGRSDIAQLQGILNQQTAAIIVGYPNFFGAIEDLPALADLAHAQGALLVVAVAEPYALSLLKSPGECGADIVIGEGQAMAVPPQFGGPGVGLFGCKQEYLRQMPGRLCGETLDRNGLRGYVLTLSTREQHIRRERATSNICTNHGLIALAFTIRTAMLGRKGYQQVGQACLDRAEHLKSLLRKVHGLSLPYSAPTFNEFVVRFEKHAAADIVQRAIREHELLAGVDLGRFSETRKHELLIAVTELHTPSDLEKLVKVLKQIFKQ